jgi:hypothetical protein
MESSVNDNLKAGTVRFKFGGETEWSTAEPGSREYSSALMIAEEVWDGEKWEKVNA